MSQSTPQNRPPPRELRICRAIRAVAAGQSTDAIIQAAGEVIAEEGYAAMTTQGQSSSNPYFLFIGMALAILAIYLSMVSYKRLAAHNKKASTKGIILSVLAGLFIAPFYTVTMYGMDPSFGLSGAGSLTPYTGAVFFALGAFLSTFIFNPFFMARPVEGDPVKMSAYFKGSFKSHFWGILGGSIWMLGMVVSFMSSGEVSTIAYALSNAAPVVAILWGVFIWKEFKGAPQGTNPLRSRRRIHRTGGTSHRMPHHVHRCIGPLRHQLVEVEDVVRKVIVASRAHPLTAPVAPPVEGNDAVAGVDEPSRDAVEAQGDIEEPVAEHHVDGLRPPANDMMG